MGLILTITCPLISRGRKAKLTQEVEIYPKKLTSQHGRHGTNSKGLKCNCQEELQLASPSPAMLGLLGSPGLEQGRDKKRHRRDEKSSERGAIRISVPRDWGDEGLEDKLFSGSILSSPVQSYWTPVIPGRVECGGGVDSPCWEVEAWRESLSC